MNGHSSAGNDEANPHPHHSLYEQMGQLVDRERVLIGENDQLRAQLVERKEQEKKKYDDLMVQYRQLRDNANIKQEDEDDHEGTSNNQVTVKTEWDDEEVKVEIKEEYEEDLDNEDPSTNAHNVTELNIKTESMECDLMEVKDEIKEEDEDDEENCDGCDRCVVKKEEVSDDDGDETRVIDIDGMAQDNQTGGECRSRENGSTIETTQLMDCAEPEIKGEFDYGHEIVIKQEEEDETTNNQIKLEIKEEEEEDNESKITDIEGLAQDNQTGGDESRSVNVQMEEEFDEVDIEGGLIRGEDHNQVDAERYEAMQVNVDCGQLVNNPSRDSQNASNEDSFNEGGAILGSEQLLNTLNEPHDQTLIQSGDVLSPWTSTGQDSSRTALNQQATGSNQHNKRKQAQLKRTGKRSKKTLQDDGDGEDEEGGDEIANKDGDEAKVKVLYLNCTQSECNVKLDSLVDLHGHLRTVHQLSPLKCFAMDCNSRFDNRTQIRDHIKLHHPQSTRFLCAVCLKEFDSQTKTCRHWNHKHLTGQFKCTFMSDCAQVTDTRRKMNIHQQIKHRSQSKLFHCTQPGCTASFAFKDRLERHELTHRNIQPFHCTWTQCSHRTNQRANLVRHIRTQHFGLPNSVKEQKEKNIVDLRDPNEYIRVVVQNGQ